MQIVAGHRVGESVEDLKDWLKSLEGCPPIHSTVLAECANPAHGEDRPTWFYVEGDSTKGIARRRCLACGTVHHVLDSESNWTAPPMHSCGNCGQSMFEVVTGLHVETEMVNWLAIGLRCVGCGTLDGLTDMAVSPALPLDDAKAAV